MWLYDPCTNILKEMSLSEIGNIGDITPSAASKAAKFKRKLLSLNCYVFKEKPSLKQRRELYESEIHEGEYWRSLSDTDYEVSNYGRVRKRYKGHEGLIMPYFRRKYMWLKLDIGGQRKEYRLRDVVASVYLKPVPNKTCVVHKNGDFTDCSVANLKRENRSKIAISTGGKASSKSVVLIDEQTKEIVDSWVSARKAAAPNYMSYQAIMDRCNGKVKSRKEGWFMWESDYDQHFEVAE